MATELPAGASLETTRGAGHDLRNAPRSPLAQRGETRGPSVPPQRSQSKVANLIGRRQRRARRTEFAVRRNSPCKSRTKRGASRRMTTAASPSLSRWHMKERISETYERPHFGRPRPAGARTSISSPNILSPSRRGSKVSRPSPHRGYQSWPRNSGPVKDSRSLGLLITRCPRIRPGCSARCFWSARTRRSTLMNRPLIDPQHRFIRLPVLKPDDGFDPDEWE